MALCSFKSLKCRLGVLVRALTSSELQPFFSNKLLEISVDTIFAVAKGLIKGKIGTESVLQARLLQKA